jgi:HAD superfamily hydrolase (TIGR01549 family)
LLVPIFDLDGTLLDSDAALVAPFLALGIPEHEVTFGRTLEHECARLGITVAQYLARYDVNLAQPYAGVDELLVELDRWAVCSNKEVVSGRAELERLGWNPDVAMFADDFGGPKELGPVVDALGLLGRDVVFVGDTEHDRRCAAVIGCRFAVAGWNVRADGLRGDVVLGRPLDLLDVLRRGV